MLRRVLVKITAIEVALACAVAVGLVDYWVDEAIGEFGAAHYAGTAERR